jgi:hypothetical protein
MTLILACATRDFAILVSDRRVTWLRGPNAGRTADDGRNKAVVVAGHIAFAYTGLAEIGITRTDDWLQENLQALEPLNIKTVSERIAERATTAFAAIPSPPNEKRQAFVGVGWFARGAPPDESDASRALDAVRSAAQPVIVAISNALDDRWDWRSEAEAKFRSQARGLSKSSPDPFAFASAGVPLTTDETHDVQRVLNRLSARVRGPEPYVRVLVSAARRVAARSSGVGADLMVAVVPRNAVGTGGFAMTFDGSIPRDTTSTFYLPAASRVGVLYGPHYVDRGIQMRGATVMPGAGFGDDFPLFFGGPLVLSLAWRPTAGAPLRVRLTENDAFPGLPHQLLVEPPSDVAVEAPVLIRVAEGDPRVANIRQDRRFVVLTGPLADPMSCPDEASVTHLLDWLRRWKVADTVVARIELLIASGANRAILAQQIHHLLRQTNSAK